MVHRDIKPENILLDRSGAPRIVDFGLALLTGPATETRLTQHARVLGTPHYMAPEQIKHPSEVDHRADIYTLGVVFYEMLTGELPVGRFPPPSQMVEVDVRLDEVVLRTLDKEPHRRYQHARELSSDVERSASGAGPRRRRETSADEDWTPTRRGRRRGLWRPEFEYRSSRTLWGLPLIHIAHNISGERMALARGIFAIGDMAVGLVAIGGFAFGGVAVGGMTGVMSLGGLAAGLLLAIGGMALGGFAAGGAAFGVLAVGGRAGSLLDLSPEAMQWVSFAAWAIVTAAVTAIVAALVIWWRASGDRDIGT